MGGKKGRQESGEDEHVSLNRGPPVTGGVPQQRVVNLLVRKVYPQAGWKRGKTERALSGKEGLILGEGSSDKPRPKVVLKTAMTNYQKGGGFPGREWGSGKRKGGQTGQGSLGGEKASRAGLKPKQQGKKQ